MSFPSYAPSSRSFNPGAYAVKKVTAINGIEHRLLYGNVRTQMSLQLSYQNIRDEEAAEFLKHYDEMIGEFLGFYLETVDTEMKDGYKGSSVFPLNANGGKWRYDGAPKMQSIRPGRSTVTVNLVGYH